MEFFVYDRNNWLIGIHSAAQIGGGFLVRLTIFRRQCRDSLKNFCVFLLILALLTAPMIPALAAEDPTVRVGYFYNGDFMHKLSDGSYAGYDIEYYKMLAGYAGWQLQFVEYDSLQSAINALENGEIDIMSGLSKTDERERLFLVSAMKMCTAHIAVQTREDDDRFAAGDTDTMENLICGILKGSNVVALYENWCRERGLTPHITEYDSLDSRNQALLNGEVDAIAGGSTIEGAQKIAEFPSLDLYFMLNRNQQARKAQLDRAMGILSLENPVFASDLFTKYFPSSRNTIPSFSAAEKAYIAAHPVLRAAVLKDDEPFSHLERDGTLTGILPEYYAHLSKVVGLEIRCVPFDSKDALYASIGSGQADLIGKAEYNIFSAYTYKILLTVPYLKMSLVQITRAGTTSVKNAAVPECNASGVSGLLEGTGVSVNIFPNSASCFDALQHKKADSVICTQPAATWLLNRYRASDYVVLAFGETTYNIASAPASGADGNTLRSILNKAIDVDGSYIQQLITSDTLADSANLTGLLDRLPVSLIAALGAAAVFLLVLAVTALFILIHRREAERRLAMRQAEVAAAAEANRAKHAFFGAVSHDMRTPLNGILGFADLALESEDSAQVRDYLGKIRASGTILNGLVNDTLIMSRLENGKYILHPEPCRTDALLGELLTPVRELAREKGIRLTDNTSTLRPRTVMADRLSLQKVFLNLLTNAVKFTPSGGTVCFSCRLEPENGEQPESIVTVSDSGSGISPEFLPHIFEPFAQEQSSNLDSSGSGIGLSIVQSIVTAMGGTIEVQSEPGRGTVFTVRLRLQELPGREPETGASGGAVLLNGRRILVCEDNALNREIIRSILTRHGAEVTEAENGRAGVEAFQKSPAGWYDDILLDLRMPVLDGCGAARAIRALSRDDARRVPIFAVSADAYPENIAECLKAGMNGHIAKPIDPEELLHTLAGN